MPIRRLRLEDLIAKLEQIEAHATLTLNEYPNAHAPERQRLIITIAKQLQTHLKDQLHHGERAARRAEDRNERSA